MQMTKISLVVAAVALCALPARARDYCYGSRSHISVGFYSGIGFYPPYYEPVYPRPIYPAPVYAPIYPAPAYGPVYAAPRPVYRGIQVSGSVEGDKLTERVQLALARKGFYDGEIDGLKGPGTRAAIKGYQTNHGLPVTGTIDGPLVRSLGLN